MTRSMYAVVNQKLSWNSGVESRQVKFIILLLYRKMSLNILNYWYDDKIYELHCMIPHQLEEVIMNQGIKINIKIFML